MPVDKEKLLLAETIASRIEAVTDLLPYELHKGQRRVVDYIFKKNYKRIVVIAGRSWGKSAVESYIASRYCCFPNKTGFIIGPTRKQQNEITWNSPDGIKSLFPKEHVLGKPYESESRIETPWSSFVKIDGSENYDAFRGVAYDFMLLDEAQMMDWRFYEACYPNLSKRDGLLMVVGTMVRDLQNPFMKLIEEAKNDPDWLVIHAPTSENPSKTVQKYIKTEKPKYIKRGDLAAWMMEHDAIYVPGGRGAVYPQYDSKKHDRPRSWFVDKFKTHGRRIDCYTLFDPGSTSVFAVLLVGINRDTNEIYVLDEVYETAANLTTPRLMWEKARKLEHKWFGERRDIIRGYDSAAAWFGIQMATEFDVGLNPIDKKSQDKLDDIGIIKDAMVECKIFFNSEDLPETLKELVSYSTDEKGRPVDKNDHNMDNLRYAIKLSGFSLNQYTSDDDENGFGETFGQAFGDSLGDQPNLEDLTNDGSILLN